MINIHATAISLDTAGVLIKGPSGSGKSDLALRLIEQGAELVADDRVDISPSANTLIMSPPTTIAGRLEIRHLGIIQTNFLDQAELKLIVILKPCDELERLPEWRSEVIEGINIPTIDLDPFDDSVVAKIKMALRILAGKASLVE